MVSEMNFLEVVNLHFAVPVFGVVLCAFLVFAFGFKSSVQPPSFNFDEDEKRSRKHKKSKKTPSQTNGHIPSNTNTTNNNVTAKQSLKKLEKVEKNVAKPAESKPAKNKKAASKSEAKTVKSASVQQENVVDDGEWETPYNRKEKERRREQRRKGQGHYEELSSDSPIDSGDDGTKVEVSDVSDGKTLQHDFSKPAPIEEVMKALAAESSSNESPQPQRKKEEKKKNKKSNKVQEETEKEEEPVEEEVKVEEVKVEEVTPTITKVEEKAPEPSKKSKKSKTKKAATPEPTPEPEPKSEPVKTKEPVKPAKEAKPAPLKPEPVPPKSEPTPAPKIPEVASLAVSEEPKVKKSPKKKNKKGQTEPGPVVEVRTETVVSNNQQSRIPPVEPSSPPLVAKKAPAPNKAAPEPAPPAEPAPVAKPAPVFDELAASAGEWTDAKQKTKKKRARRDN